MLFCVSTFGGDGHLLRMTKRRKGQLLVGLHIPRTPRNWGVTRKAEPRPRLSDDQLGPALRPTASSVAGGYIIEKGRERKRHQTAETFPPGEQRQKFVAMAKHWTILAADVESLEAQFAKEPANTNEPYRFGSRIDAQQSHTAEREEEAAT